MSEMATNMGKTTTEFVLSVVVRLVQIAEMDQSEIGPADLLEAFAYAHLLAYGTAYHRLLSQMDDVPLSKTLAQELWDRFRDMAFFHNTPQMFYHFIRSPKFRPFRHLFFVKAIDFDLNKIMPEILRGHTKLHMSPLNLQEEVKLEKEPQNPEKGGLDGENEEESKSSKGMLMDWYMVLKNRTRSTNSILPGQRRDWLKEFPNLTNWENLTLKSQLCIARSRWPCTSSRNFGFPKRSLWVFQKLPVGLANYSMEV